jgi:hypothetical protein
MAMRYGLLLLSYLSVSVIDGLSSVVSGRAKGMPWRLKPDSRLGLRMPGLPRGESPGPTPLYLDSLYSGHTIRKTR